MYCNILDEKGRIRGGIFYKAAFYDRRASVTLSPRTCYAGDGANRYDTIITDAGKTIHKIGNRGGGVTPDRDRELALAWLNKNYPDWEKVGAYWD